MSWEPDKEKLLCLVVLDDDLAQRLSVGASDAFFRAFIVKNRETNEITMKFRFSYLTGERSWYEVAAKSEIADPRAYLEGAIRKILMLGLQAFAPEVRVPDEAVSLFRPPDDEGDPFKTIEWLHERDLIEVKAIEGPLGNMIKVGKPSEGVN